MVFSGFLSDINEFPTSRMQQITVNKLLGPFLRFLETLIEVRKYKNLIRI